uniref:Uncharacterized protein n=1 Tax=Arundo donax TaxID=35708 RepID=A0A0A8YKL6_ARUDO
MNLKVTQVTTKGQNIKLQPGTRLYNPSIWHHIRTMASSRGAILIMKHTSLFFF